MKKHLLSGLLLGLMTLLSGYSFGQIKGLKINVSSNYGYEYNLFHSPTTYMDDEGLSFLKSDLIKNSPFANQGISINYNKIGKKGSWYLRADADRTLYMKYKEANTDGIQARLGRKQHLAKSIESETQFRLRRENRLGLNILGDELFTVFSFKQYQANQIVTFKLSKELALEVGGEIYYKDYDPLLNEFGSSLDQIEHSYEATFTYKPRKKEAKKYLKALSLSFDHREKQYQDWVNYEIVDLMADSTNPTPFLPFDSLTNYPLRRWEYNTLRLRYQLPLTKNLDARLDFRVQDRADSSEGDFGYSDRKGTLRISWEKGDWKIGANASYTSRNYTFRRAEQDTIMVLPNLHYTYFRTKIDVTKIIEPGVGLNFKYEVINRGSNTTAIDRRTRREYFNTLVSVGLKWQL